MSEVYHTTPHNPNYETCEETRASLLIYPKNILAEDVTALLGVTPTVSYNRGDLIPLRARGNLPERVRENKHSVWFLQSEHNVQSKDLRDHIDWVVEKIFPQKEALHSLQKIPGMKMRLSCVWWSALGGGGPTLWPEQMRSIAELGLELTLDFSFYGEDEKQALGGQGPSSRAHT